MMSEVIIQNVARSILAACPSGTRVILFGSHARGDAHADSDLDFLVIEPEVKSRMAEAARLARVIRPLRASADILVIDRPAFEEWKDSLNSVFHEAAQEGRVFA